MHAFCRVGGVAVGRTLVSASKLSLSFLRQTSSQTDDHFVGQTSAIGQPTWPTQPSILALDLEGVHDVKLHHPSSSVATSNQ